MRREELAKLSRDALVEHAHRAGVHDVERLDDDAIIEALTRQGASERRIATMKSWFNVARDLVARVVDRGLHLPEAAELLRASARATPLRRPPPPLPTVTLAEIYAAQGYHAKAVAVLDEVLARRPDHVEASAMRDVFLARLSPEERARAEKAASSSAPPPSAPPPSAPPPSAPPPSAPPPSAPPPAAPPASSIAPSSPPPPSVPPPAIDATVRAPGGTAEMDELVALATDPRTVYVYWELRPLFYARARAADPAGRLVLRVLTVVAGTQGGEATSRDVLVDQLVGDRFVRNLTPGSEVRMCLGWAGAGGFSPLVVATELTMPRDYRAELPATVWLDPATLAQDSTLVRGFGRSSARSYSAYARAADSSQSAALSAAAAGKRMRRYVELVAARRGVPIVDFHATGSLESRGAPAPGPGATQTRGSLGGASDRVAAAPGRGGASDQR